ncbi:MAG: hypothetical protein B7Z37_25435 [Verrucomicrobia bacterium 12-59-8]|nr:MAG: hypothetical protein B7Z37_25435 [Verrucomicrobia bacterium 12-59-8]
MNEFDLLFESGYLRIITEIGPRRRNDGGNKAELGWQGRFADTMTYRVKFNEVLGAELQFSILILQSLPVEIERLQDSKFISESTRLLGLDLAAAAPVRPNVFAVVRAKVA